MHLHNSHANALGPPSGVAAPGRHESTCGLPVCWHLSHLEQQRRRREQEPVVMPVLRALLAQAPGAAYFRVINEVPTSIGAGVSCRGRAN
jgi:hypothetical protein